MLPKYIYFCLFLYLHDEIRQCNTIAVTYMNTERPVVTYIYPLYFRNVTVHSRRHNRKDPRYYISADFQLLRPMDNNFKYDYYFYQLLTNRYRPSFVELHFRLCDFLEKDLFIGNQIKKNVLNSSCPYPPGHYSLTDMAIPFVPKNFPFDQGRIYLNITKSFMNNTEIIANGYIDMEIKTLHLNNKKP